MSGKMDEKERGRVEKVVGVVEGGEEGLEGRNIRKGRQGEDGAGATIRQMGGEATVRMTSGWEALTARA